MRYLAVDLGGKRTGLAVGDRSTLIATPLEVLEIPPGPRLIEAIRHTIAEHGPDAIVIGLPLNMDGSEGEASKQVRAFGSALAEATSLPVEFHDERLSSRASVRLSMRTPLRAWTRFSATTTGRPPATP